MIENGLFVLGGPETQLHDILWVVHDGKNRGRSVGDENIREFPITVGGRVPSDACFYHTRTCVGERHWALTEPERGVRLTEPKRLQCRLRVTELERSSDSFSTTSN